MISLLIGVSAFLRAVIASVIVDPQPSCDDDRGHALPVDVTTLTT